MRLCDCCTCTCCACVRVCAVNISIVDNRCFVLFVFVWLCICVVVGCQMFVKVVLSCIFCLFYFCVQNKLEPLSGISLLLIFAVVVLNVFF